MRPPALTATSASGTLLFGGVPPGEFALFASAPGRTCRGGIDDWPAAGGAQAAGLALADTLTGGTELIIGCESE